MPNINKKTAKAVTKKATKNKKNITFSVSETDVDESEVKESEKSDDVSESSAKFDEFETKDDDDTNINLGNEAEETKIDTKGTLLEKYAEAQPEESSDESVQSERLEGGEPPVLDREYYEELHVKLTIKLLIEKLTNHFIHKRLAEYYKKRKIFYVLKDAQAAEKESESRYEKQLDKLDDVKTYYQTELKRVAREFKEMEQKKAVEQAKAEENYKKLQEIELAASKVIVYNIIQGNLDKIISKHLKRQSMQVEQLQKVRLAYIKIRNKTNAKQLALNAMDNLGSNLRLVDYEQLRLDNQNHRDYMEQRDVELNELRDKYQNSKQTLAHRLEKVNFIGLEMNYMQKSLNKLAISHDSLRSELGDVNRRRKNVRNQIAAIKKSAGLLNHPKLVEDMEESYYVRHQLSYLLTKVEKEYEDRHQFLERLHQTLNSKEEIRLLKLRHKFQTKDLSLLDTANVL